MKRVLILVLSADTALYQQLDRSIRETWGRGDPDIRYYYPNRPSFGMASAFGEVTEYEDVLVSGYEPVFESILAETLAVYRYVADWPYDYVLRCCSGSYVVREEMLRFLDDKPTERFYCGVVGTLGSVNFASGAGCILSMDLVRQLGQAREELLALPYPGYQDDVAVGMYFQDRGLTITPAPRVEPNQLGAVIPGHHHYHVGASPQNMYAVHKLFEDARSLSVAGSTQ